jgi:serine/threonine-protein kinase
MIGRTLRQYVVIEQLGQGGMGVVWKARDTILDRYVALKVLPAEYVADSERRERLVREAKAASALNHPNIVTIYEINSDQDLLYIAMEFVPGRTLASVLGRGPLALDDAIRYATQIAEGMDRAHRAGVIHRDLKPGNVIVAEDGLVKVLDFGLAKVAASEIHLNEDAVATSLTRAGIAVGTLGYMSPEQTLGDAVDARSDVFAFGVMFYQMLTGVLPFGGSTQTEVLRNVHFSDPRPVDLTRRDVPQQILRIVDRSLSKNADDRYASMVDVAAALRDAAPSVPVDTAAASIATPEPRPRAGRRGAAAVALLLGSTIAAATLLAWLYLPPTTQPGRVAPVGALDAGPYELSQQAAQLLMRDDREANVDQAISVLQQAIQGDSQHAPAYAYLARAYIQKHQTSPDPQWLKLAHDSADRAVALGPDLALAHLFLGFVHQQAGDKDAAGASFRKASDLDPMNPNVVSGLGRHAETVGEDDEAERLLRRAADLAPQDWHHPMRLGQFFYERARFEEAVSAWERTRSLTPDNVLLLRNLAAVYFRSGQYDDAASSIQRALEVRPTAGTYTNLGTIRFFQGRYVDAVPAFEKAVELGANNHLMWANLADAYRWAPGRRPDSVPAYRRAIALIKEQIAKSPASPDFPTRHAVYLAKMGDMRAALEELGRLAGEANLTAQMHFRMAVVYELASDRNRALAALERALRASYPVTEVAADPEMISMRADVRYHRLIDALGERPPR